MERWIYLPVNDLRWNDLCTKEATGTCALCDALAERDRFERRWFKGGVFVDGVHAMQRRGVFAFLRRYAFRLVFFSCVGLMLWLTWFILRSARWRSTVSRFMDENPVFIIALLISLVVPLFWLFLWKLPQWKVTAVPEEKDRIDLELKSRQTSIQIVGLIGGLVGAAALLGGLYFTSRTLRTSQETLQVNQETLRTTQEGQITERFTKAIDQLGRDNLAMRLGGIYALERIARDSAKDHWPVMEVLTAFVREQVPAKTIPSDNASGEGKTKGIPQESKLRSDIQAILTVIGRRIRTFGNGEIDPLNLSNTNLQGADLREAKLQGARLTRTQLQNANLIWAQLQGASLTRAQLQGKGTELTRAQLQGASLAEAQLQDTSLFMAQLQDAILIGAQLQRANLAGAQLERANLRGAQLQDANLEWAQLQGADLRPLVVGPQLQHPDFDLWALIEKGGFTERELREFSLRMGRVQEAAIRAIRQIDIHLSAQLNQQFERAGLTGEQFQRALAEAQLERAGLIEAQLQRANLAGAQLERANLRGAQLQGANLRGAKNLTQEQINTACVDETTALPEGLTKPVPCPTPLP